MMSKGLHDISREKKTVQRRTYEVVRDAGGNNRDMLNNQDKLEQDANLLFYEKFRGKTLPVVAIFGCFDRGSFLINLSNKHMPLFVLEHVQNVLDPRYQINAVDTQRGFIFDRLTGKSMILEHARRAVAAAGTNQKLTCLLKRNPCRGDNEGSNEGSPQVITEQYTYNPCNCQLSLIASQAPAPLQPNAQSSPRFCSSSAVAGPASAGPASPIDPCLSSEILLPDNVSAAGVSSSTTPTTMSVPPSCTGSSPVWSDDLSVPERCRCEQSPFSSSDELIQSSPTRNNSLNKWINDVAENIVGVKRSSTTESKLEGNEEDAAAPAESDGKRARLFLSAKKMFNGGKTLAGQCCSATRSGRGGKGDTVLPESSQQMGRWVDAEVAGRRDGGTHENACRNLLTIGLAHASAKGSTQVAHTDELVESLAHGMQNLATAEEKPNPRGHYGPAVSAAAPSASPPSATVAALAEDGDKDAQDSDSMGVYDDDLSPPPKRELSHQRGRFRKLPSEALPGAAENAQTADRVQQSGIVRPPTPFAQRGLPDSEGGDFLSTFTEVGGPMDELMNLLSTGGEAIDPDGVAANEEDSSAPIISVENCSDDEGGNQSSSSKHWKELLLLQQQQQRRQNVIEMVLRSWVSSLEPEKGPLQMLIDEPGSPAEGATAPSSAPSFAAVGTASTASAGCPCAFMAGGSPDVAMDPHAMFKGFSEQFKLDRENSLKRLKEMLLWASTVPPEMFADHDFMDLNEPL